MNVQQSACMPFRACVIIPIYNHKDAIAAAIHGLKPFRLKCIIVDDGSNLETKEILDELKQAEPWIELVALPSNQGKGAAVMRGIEIGAASGFSHALQVDADGQHDLNDVPRLLQAAAKHPQALVTGRPIFDASAPKSRVIGRYLTHIWVWIETLSFQIKDSMCGFRVYPLAITARLLQAARVGKRMEFDTEVMVRLFWEGVRVESLPTRIRYPDDGVSHFDLIKDNVRISKMHMRLFFGMLKRFPRLLLQKSRKDAPEAGHWSQMEERGSYLGIRVMLWTYRCFGTAGFRPLLYAVMAYFFLANGPARRNSLAFLRRAYAMGNGEGGLQKEPTPADAFRHFIAFAEAMLDKIACWSGEIGLRDIHFEDRAVLEELAQRRQGAVLIGSHLGNLEVCRALAEGSPGIKLNALMLTHHARAFNRLLKKVNPRAHLAVIEMDAVGPELAIRLQNKIDQGEFVSIVGDRTPVRGDRRASYIEFLGESAPFPQGPFVLAGLLQCPVFLLFCLKQDGVYRVYLERFSERLEFKGPDGFEALQQAMEKYAARLEYYAVRAPFQWFNFFDFWQRGSRHAEAGDP